MWRVLRKYALLSPQRRRGRCHASGSVRRTPLQTPSPFKGHTRPRLGAARPRPFVSPTHLFSEHSDVIFLIGQSYRIHLQPSFRNCCIVEGERLVIYHTTPPDVACYVQQAARQALKEYLEIRVPVYTARLGCRYNRIFIKEMFSRWGSCSSLGNLNFALRLAYVPRRCLDYVIAHEVCHLIHMNHGPAFWALVEVLCPTYRQDRQELKGVGQNLWIEEKFNKN